MAFSGSGSAATRAHTHDSTIVNDGGSLNLDNITQGGAAMTAGAITYSDGPAGHMQVLTLGTPAQLLQVNAGGTAPEWGAAAGGGGTTFFSYNTTGQNFTSSTYFSAFPSGGNNVWGYAESEFVIPCNTDLTFTRYRVNMRANNKASNQVTAFRDDGVNVAPITIPASTSGTFDSGVVSVSIAAGSLICWAYHATVSGTLDMYATLGTVTT